MDQTYIEQAAKMNMKSVIRNKLPIKKEKMGLSDNWLLIKNIVFNDVGNKKVVILNKIN